MRAMARRPDNSDQALAELKAVDAACPLVGAVEVAGGKPLQEALREGAAAFVAKSIDPFDLPAVLRAALTGSVYFSTPQVSRETVVDFEVEAEQEAARRSAGLTPRELEILGAVSNGLSNRAIGAELFLSDQTVKFHLHRIYRKLGVANRTEAAGLAHRLGLLRDLARAG